MWIEHEHQQHGAFVCIATAGGRSVALNKCRHLCAPQVTIDSRGMMKVAHMMAIGTGGPGEFPGSQRGSMASQVLLRPAT